MILMKLLKNYLNNIKELKRSEKSLNKEMKNEAREKSFLKALLVFLPFYLITMNLLFMFINHFYLLFGFLNILIFLNIYYYQYKYYSYLNLNKYHMSIVKTLFYGLILSIIVWVIAYVIGRFI